MVQLVGSNISGASLVPDFSGANRLALGIAQQFKAQQVEKAEQQEAGEIRAILLKQNIDQLSSDPDLMSKIFRLEEIQDGAGKIIFDTLAKADEIENLKLAQTVEDANTFYGNFQQILKTDGPTAANELLRLRIIDEEVAGDADANTDILKQMLVSNPDEQGVIANRQLALSNTALEIPDINNLAGRKQTLEEAKLTQAITEFEAEQVGDGGFVGDIQPPSPKDFTPDSISDFQRSGDARDLVRRALSGTEKRQQERIDVALRSSQQIPVINRAIEILEDIETGGVEGVKLRARQFFGVESADEGELSNQLGKAVLAQLRATFGAQFTEGEGDRLISIEPGIGKSNAANLRIFRNLLKKLETDITVGKRNAERLDDDTAILDIDDFLAIEFGGPADDNTGKGGF